MKSLSHSQCSQHARITLIWISTLHGNIVETGGEPGKHDFTIARHRTVSMPCTVPTLTVPAVSRSILPRHPDNNNQ